MTCVYGRYALVLDSFQARLNNAQVNVLTVNSQ